MTWRWSRSPASQASTSAPVVPSRQRVRTASVDSGPSPRTRSRTSSASRAARSGVSRWSSASVRATCSASRRSRSASPSAEPSSSASSDGVEGQRGGPALGEGGVALVEELGDVAEEQGLGEGRRRGALDVDDGDLARPDVAHEVDEAGHVEHVLDALAHRLEDDGERGVAARDLEQLRGALALLPQRLAPVGAASGEQERPGRALAEARREQGRAADLLGDQAAHVVGVERHEVEELATRPRGRRGRRPRRPRRARCRAGAARCRRRRASPGRRRRSGRASAR